MQYVLCFAILTFVIELLTCFGRFVFHMRSREIQRRLLGIRVHHGYAAPLIVPAFFFLPAPWILWSAAVAGALLVSDLIHHFVVLPLATGRFD